MKVQRVPVLLFLLILFSLSGFAWQSGDPNSQTAVPDSGTPTFKTEVVSRSLKSVNYRRSGSTEVSLHGTDLMPEAKGEARVESRTGRVIVDVDLDHMRPANTFGMEHLTYVLWAVTPQGRASNLGELVEKNGKGSLKVTTDLQAFGLIVTAEPYFAVTQPSDLVVAENIVRSDTKGREELVDVRYNLLPRDIYKAQVTPVDAIYGMDKHIPLDLLEARNAVRIARDAGAEQYSSTVFAKAAADLQQAEDYYRRKQGSGPIGTVAREASQTAEEARVMTIRHKEEERIARERAEQEQRTSAAQAEAAARTQQAQQAEAERQAAAQRASEAQAESARLAQQRQEAEAQRQAAEQAKAQADQARQQAEQAQQQAEQARSQAERARQQAETDKAQLRARLLQQLNAVLQTKDTARGLVATMPDVLFATGSSNLRPEARERLARVAGILLAYPDIHIEIDGHTDSTGSLAFNEKLSQQRAESVRSYLTQQGVSNNLMATQGFGPTQPIASNNTPQGRQQNRRVELVVTGEAIGQTMGSPAAGVGADSSVPPATPGASPDGTPTPSGNPPPTPAPAQGTNPIPQ